MKISVCNTLLLILLAVFSPPSLSHNSQLDSTAHMLEHGTIYAALIVVLVAASLLAFHLLARSKATTSTK